MGKVININSRKFGIGTSAFVISIIAIMFSFTSLGQKTIGHIYRENYGAKIGRNIAIFFIILMAYLTVISK